MHALGLEFGSAAQLSKRPGSVWNCLWGNALKRSPGIIRKSRVSYPGPRFLSSATWPSLPKKHYNGLIPVCVFMALMKAMRWLVCSWKIGIWLMNTADVHPTRTGRMRRKSANIWTFHSMKSILWSSIGMKFSGRVCIIILFHMYIHVLTNSLWITCFTSVNAGNTISLFTIIDC